jgi:hypothetical protein
LLAFGNLQRTVIGNRIFLLLLTAFPIFLYFKIHPLASFKIKKTRFEGAKKWLSLLKPETALVRTNNRDTITIMVSC